MAAIAAGRARGGYKAIWLPTRRKETIRMTVERSCNLFGERGEGGGRREKKEERRKRKLREREEKERKVLK